MRTEALVGVATVALIATAAAIASWAPPGPREPASPSRHATGLVPAPDAVLRRPTLMSRPRGDAGARDPLFRALHEAPDLGALVLRQLPAAAAGDGASSYLIYLALEQCRDFVHGGPAVADAILTEMLSRADLSAEERRGWQADYEQCRGMGAVDWPGIARALGLETPVDAQDPSRWFERAADSGYPVAVAEQALRLGPFTGSERRQMLERAVLEGGAPVYWLLFVHAFEPSAGGIEAPALAWLMAACRAGYDCSGDARWHRGLACREGRACEPGRSALEHYETLASAPVRERARTLSQQIARGLATQSIADLPLPPLDRLDARIAWQGL